MDDSSRAAVTSPLTELIAYAAPERRIFAKHEYFGPTGSIKDRMVEWALLRAIQSGELSAGTEIAEASSGNTGAALAWAGTRLGFPVRIFVSKGVSKEKIDTIERFGGKVHEVEVSASRSEIEAAYDYAKSNGAYLFNQFENPYHIPAYKETLGSEILSQLNQAPVRIDHFVGGLGSGGSIRAIGELLKERYNKELKIWATVPASYPSNIEGLNPGHLRKSGHFQIWLARAANFETAIVEVQDDDAFRQVLSLKASSGIFVGPASGSCLHVARHLPHSGNVLILLTDTGAKYSRKLRSWQDRLGISS